MTPIAAIILISLGIAHLTQPGADNTVPGIISLTSGICLLAA
jgi:hypothetical protein